MTSAVSEKFPQQLSGASNAFIFLVFAKGKFKRVKNTDYRQQKRSIVERSCAGSWGVFLLIDKVGSAEKFCPTAAGACY